MKDDWKIITLLFCLIAVISWPLYKDAIHPFLELVLSDKYIELIIVTVVAAFGGAYGGQYIAEYKHDQRLLLEEFRYSNAVIMGVFGIINSLINMRTQHTNSLREEFYDTKAQIELHEIGIAETGRVTPFNYQPNLLTLPPIKFSTESLKSILFEKISAGGRPIVLINVLSQSLDSLSESLNLRNAILAKLQAANLPDEIFVRYYFGLPIDERTTDMTHAHTIDNIYASIEEVQFFGRILCRDLLKHARDLRDRINISGLRIDEPDFESINKEYMPDENKYPDWINNFK